VARLIAGDQEPTARFWRGVALWVTDAPMSTRPGPGLDPSAGRVPHHRQRRQAPMARGPVRAHAPSAPQL